MRHAVHVPRRFNFVARARKPKTAPGPTEALVRRQQRAQEEAGDGHLSGEILKMDISNPGK